MDRRIQPRRPGVCGCTAPQTRMISIVIPTLDEEKALPATLRSVFRQVGVYEIILVDGGSRDDTVRIARSGPCGQVLCAPRGRASQMNTGARAARGEWLLFLHADTLLPDGALALLNALETHRDCRAGGFRHRFSGDDWRLRLISRLDNLRCARTGIIYGDQAMFVRRELFWALGGFPDTRMLEDVMFCESLLRATRPLLLDEEVVTDARKFIRMGPWRSLARVLAILLAYELRLPIPARSFFSDVR
jgi:rSAM/selenodomain-associated transferase 2